MESIMRKVLVWDLPTRLFHWLLAASFAGAFLTAESERLRGLHVMLGYTMLGLVAFRLLWGLIGTRYARFSSCAFGAKSVVAYVKSLFTSSPTHYLGHNPAASWAVYALLALSIAAGATGYASYNDIGGHWLEEAHEAAANVLLAVVFVHITGVLASSLIHRENLIRSMIDGLKKGEPASGIRYRHRIVATALALAVGASWLGGAVYFGTAPGTASYADNAAHGEHRHRD
jgi:cytochrome b